MSKHLDKIEKKIEQIEKHHDKASILCEEIKDLIAELNEEDLENDEIEETEDDEDLEDDLDEDFDEDDDIDNKD